MQSIGGPKNNITYFAVDCYRIFFNILGYAAATMNHGCFGFTVVTEGNDP